MFTHGHLIHLPAHSFFVPKSPLIPFCLLFYEENKILIKKNILINLTVFCGDWICSDKLQYPHPAQSSALTCLPVRVSTLRHDYDNSVSVTSE